MANNLQIKDAIGIVQTVKSTADGNSVHTPHHNVTLTSDDPAVAVLQLVRNASISALRIANEIRNSNTGVVSVVGSGLTTLTTVSNIHSKLLCYHFDVAAQNLDDFQVYGRAHTSAQLTTFTPASWTTLPGGNDRFLRASANLAAIAATGNGYFEMDISGLVEVTVKASAVADSANVTSWWSIQ
jgi:hypothetical protein